MKFALCALLVIVVGLSALVAHLLGYPITADQWGAKLSVLAAVTVGSIAFFKKVIIPAASHITVISSLMEEVKSVVKVHNNLDFEKLVEDVAQILKDLRPNSGTSMRDAINRIESRLIQMEGVQEALQQDGPVAIFRCTPDGSNLEVNRTFCRWLQCTENELIGFGWKNFVYRYEEEYDLIWRSAFSDGRELQFPMIWRDTHGEAIECNINAYPIFNKDKELVEYLGIIYRKDTPFELKAVEK